MEEKIDHAALTRLDGRGIVVLGAGGGGIGSAVTRLLAAGGANLLCVDNVEAQARAAADEAGGEAHVADITNRAQLEKVFARAEALFGARFYGVVDIVGRGARPAGLETFDDATIDDLFTMNVRHALMAVQIAAPMLAARGRGALAFISSLAAETAAPGQSIYGMAKAALNHLVRYAADEFGPRGVRTNGIGTGLILTPGLKAVSNSTYIKQVIDHVPMRRIGQPSDIAGAVYFLMSDLAAYVNGSILHVEGGDLYGSRGYPHMPPSAG